MRLCFSQGLQICRKHIWFLMHPVPFLCLLAVASPQDLIKQIYMLNMLLHGSDHVSVDTLVKRHQSRSDKPDTEIPKAYR